MTHYGERLRKFIIWGLGAYVFLVTIAFTTRTENTVIIKSTLGQSLIFGLTLLWFARMVEEKRFRLSPAAFNVPLVCLLLGCVFSLALSDFPYYSLEEVARFASYFLSVWLIYNNVENRREYTLLLNALLLGAAGSVIYGLMQNFGIDFVPWGAPVFLSTFGNANFFSAFLMTALPVALGMTFASRELPWRIAYGVLFLLGIWCLIIAKTRSSWLGMMAGLFIFACAQLIFYGILARLRDTGFRKRLIAVITVFLLCVVAAIAVSNEGFKQYYDEFTSAFRIHYSPVEGGTNRVRIVMWIGALKLWAEKPLFGQGIGNFQLVFPRFRPSYYHRWGVSHNTRHAHSELMEIACEQGILGLTLFLWFWVTIVYCAGRHLLKERSRYWKQVIIGLLAAFVAHTGDNLVAPHLRWAATAVAAYFAIGLTFTAIRLAGQEQRNPGRPAGRQRGMVLTRNAHPAKILLYCLFIVIFVSIAYTEWRIFSGDTMLKMGEAYLRQAGDRRTSENINTWDTAHASFLKAIELNPYDHSALYKSAYMYLQIGKLDTALDTFKELTSIAPNYAQIHFNLGLNYSNLNRPFDAISEFITATRIESNFHNHRILQGYLQQPPYFDYLRALDDQERLAGLALDKWLRNMHIRLDYTRIQSDLLPGMDGLALYSSKSDYLTSFVTRARTWAIIGDERRANYFTRRTMIWDPLNFAILGDQVNQLAQEHKISEMQTLIVNMIVNVPELEVRSVPVTREILTRIIGIVSDFADANAANASYWNLLGIGYKKLGDLERAGAAFRYTLQRLDPENPVARRELQDVQQRVAAQQQSRQTAAAPTPSAASFGQMFVPSVDIGGNRASSGFVR